MTTRAVILIVALWALSIALAATGHGAIAGTTAVVSVLGLRMLAIAGRSSRA